MDRESGQGDGGTMAPANQLPAVAIHETPASYQIHLDLPGHGSQGRANLGEKRHAHRQRPARAGQGVQEGKTHHVGHHFSHFVYSFTLPENADQGNIKTISKNGELSLTVAKKAESRAINVKIS